MKPTMIRSTLLAVALACLLPQGLKAAAPNWQSQLNYQGQLTDSAGNAVPDGPYNLTFRLYTVATAGAAILTESPVAGNASKGLFNVILGTVTPLSSLSTVQLGGDLWLSLQVQGDALEMAPRQALLPSQYSRNAQYLQGLLPNNTPNNLVVLDGVGKLPAGVVSSGGLPLPMDLTGNGGSFNLNVKNTSATPSDRGLVVQAPIAISATSTDVNGAAVWGQSSAADTAAASALRGSAINGN